MSFRVGDLASVCVCSCVFSCVSGSDSVCLNMSYEVLVVLVLKVTVRSLNLSTCMHCHAYLTHNHLCICVFLACHICLRVQVTMLLGEPGSPECLSVLVFGSVSILSVCPVDLSVSHTPCLHTSGLLMAWVFGRILILFLSLPCH